MNCSITFYQICFSFSKAAFMAKSMKLVVLLQSLCYSDQLGPILSYGVPFTTNNKALFAIFNTNVHFLLHKNVFRR